MFIYLNAQIIVDDIRNKLFPGGWNSPIFITKAHLQNMTPKVKGHDFMGKLHGDAPNED